LLVRAHPLAAGEERRLDALAAQVVDDGAVVAGDLAQLLAQIEGEGDELSAGWQIDAAHGAGRALGCSALDLGRQSFRRWRRVVVLIVLARHVLACLGGERLGREARVAQCLVAGRRGHGTAEAYDGGETNGQTTQARRHRRNSSTANL